MRGEEGEKMDCKKIEGIFKSGSCTFEKRQGENWIVYKFDTSDESLLRDLLDVFSPYLELYLCGEKGTKQLLDLYCIVSTCESSCRPCGYKARAYREMIFPDYLYFSSKGSAVEYIYTLKKRLFEVRGIKTHYEIWENDPRGEDEEEGEEDY